ncbi:hypothetical protein ONJ95_25845, partial [Salmonella enterica subsp. enterica serovar Virginia]|nr:hypothetical protein [Salmonella enterica subsp. enterica serovar Virginia]
NSARKGTNHVALKINILQQFARWRFCAYRACVYALFAGWIRREEGFEFVYGSKFTLTDRIIEVSLARYSRQRPKKIYIQRKSVG